MALQQDNTLIATCCQPIETSSGDVKQLKLSTDAANCFGCTACMAICQNGAISFKPDSEGFLSPTIDASLCIDCGSCKQVCPALNVHKNSSPLIVYAAWSSKEEERQRSSSGALFPLMARHVIENGGVVAGAIMESFYVRHTIINNIDDICLLQGSKYVQSDMGDIFIRIKKLLESPTTVLFSGTPCQVSGLRNFLKKNYSNLITIDLICHGVPSPGVFQKYVEELKRRGYAAESVTFRSKRPLWTTSYPFSLYDKNGNVIFSEKSQFNAYLKGFLKNLYLRRSCAHCPFTSSERVGDISLGDFWKISEYNESLNDKKGTSLCMINTEIGTKLFRAIKDDLECVKDIPIDFAVSTSGPLRRPSKASPYRAKFFKHYATDAPLLDWLEKNLFKVGVLNFHDSNNYGARLVPFALCKTIEKIGYQVEVINFLGKKETFVPIHEKFREEHLTRSKPIINVKQLKAYAPYWKRIVVGSDQVWKYRNTSVYMLEWACGWVNLISYSASFGDQEYSGRIPVADAKKLLERFDCISVREKSGIDICRDTFGVPAIQVIDPTMLLERNDYEQLISVDEAQSLATKPYACYILLESDNKEEIQALSKRQEFSDYTFINAKWNAKEKTFSSVARWLAAIRDADFVITDSFHATVFSILFEKQFALVQAHGRGTERLPSLLKMFHIDMSRIYERITDITLAGINTPINYVEVAKLLSHERERGFMYLKSALEKPLTYKAPV